MDRKTYATIMAELLRNNSRATPGARRVQWGDSGLLDDCWYAVNGIHAEAMPNRRWAAVLTGLARRPDLFKRGYVSCHLPIGSTGKRRRAMLRCFQLIKNGVPE